MNVSIKPFLILTSSPQMASLIYPFPRILAVHLKYAAANTSWKQPPNCQGHMGLLAFMPRTSLRTHSSHHLPTAMARYDYNYTTGLPRKKPDHAAASFGSTSFCVFFFCVFFFLQPVSGYSSSLQQEQKPMLQYAGTTAGKASHIQPHFQRALIVVGKG